jgi:hypothetical protein
MGSSTTLDVSVTVATPDETMVRGGSALCLPSGRRHHNSATPAERSGNAKDFEPGKSQSITIGLAEHASSYLDTPLHVWSAAVGTSSEARRYVICLSWRKRLNGVGCGFTLRLPGCLQFEGVDLFYFSLDTCPSSSQSRKSGCWRARI